MMKKKQEQLKTGSNPEPKYRGIKAMPFVIGNETFEKLGTIGTSSNLLIYLTSVFHMKTITATNILNVFNGTCNIGTLVGAFLCDTYFGRYNTLGFASVSSFLGMLILTLTAAVSGLHPPPCANDATHCVGASAGQIVFLFFAFALLVIGASGIRPCNLAFGADQFNPKTDFGKRGIKSFFNWYYLTYTFAMMISLTVIVYVQSNASWSIGLGIPTFLMFLSTALFYLGTRLYVIVLPEGSPLIVVAQVVVSAVRKRKLKLPEDPKMSLFNQFSADSTINAKLPYTDQFRFLNKAAIITPEDKINEDGTAASKWKLSTIQNIEEVKCLLKVMPVWIAVIIYFISVVQLQNYVVFQALQSDRRLVRSSSFRIPAASYIVFAMLTLTIWIPIFDRALVPWMTRKTGVEGGITVLQRMGIGAAMSVITMVIAGVVETNRRHIALTKPALGFEPRKGAISSMSGLWLVPQLVLSGLSEAFTIIGMNEFFYQQCPENMRSIAMAFVFVGLAGSSYLSSFLSSIVQSITSKSNGESWLAEDLNKGRLDNFYYLLAALELANFIYFLVSAKWYKYKKTEDSASSPELAMEKIHQEEKSIV
ncbi:OLC1v1012766C1 [Oldenlandia corymbosa var. corymbosa]|uniref:OLC1v1012766C1 n=1 Tax=Oldenlandia corymbosa var. corymbosa TaxID=529605 RepID=A0AAV1DWN5_OLDCO|nr:OLC1v1012766C1 [Oldenlandia corymbosa var. corymbosa]